MINLTGLVTYGQVEFVNDTTTRPSRTNSVRIGSIGNQPYLVPKTGNTVQIATGTVANQMSLAALRANTSPSPPLAIQLTDKNRHGAYYLDDSDKSTPDNGGTVLVTSSGKRYKLQEPGFINVTQFGVKVGSGLTNAERTVNTVALQNAVKFGKKLLFPDGVIEVNGTITATNTPVNWVGFGQMSIVRQMADKNLFVVNQGTSVKRNNN